MESSSFKTGKTRNLGDLKWTDLAIPSVKGASMAGGGSSRAVYLAQPSKLYGSSHFLISWNDNV